MAITFSPKIGNLIWQHFKKVKSAPDGSDNDAHTSPKYALKIPNYGGIVKKDNTYSVAKMTIDVALDLSKTWVIKGRESDKLLAHEKRHWMMDIIIAYEMERAILNLSSTDVKTLKQQIQDEFDWHRTDREKYLADKYDSETGHGTEPIAQSQWNTKVDQWYSDKSISE